MVTAVYTVDRDYRVVWANPDTFPALVDAAARNAVVFDAFPGVAEAGLKDLIDRAWETGTHSQCILYAGAINWVSANLWQDENPDTLTLSVEVLPLEGLLDCVTRLLAETGQVAA